MSQFRWVRAVRESPDGDFLRQLQDLVHVQTPTGQTLVLQEHIIQFERIDDGGRHVWRNVRIDELEEIRL